MSEVQKLFDGARVLCGELQQLGGRFETLALRNGCDWVARELDGYPAGWAVPRYRQVLCAIWGELVGPTRVAEVVPLLTEHLSRGDRAVIRAGLQNWSEFAGREGFRLEAGAYIRDIDSQQHALYLRGMPAERSGWRVLKAWESVPGTGLLQMLCDIGDYGRTMHQGAMRRQRPSTRP